MSESAESDIQSAYVGAPCKLICVRKAATAAQLVVARPMGGTTLSAEGQYRGSAMESQEQSPGDVVTAGEDSHPITQAIDAVEVTHAGATAPAANTMNPPTIPLAPMKRMQARFNPLADGLMYVVVFVGGFVGVGCRHALDMLLPSVSGAPFVVGTLVSNMVACFLFAMLTEFMATASWLRRRVRQVVSRGVGLGLLGGLSTMSGVMLETMEGMREQRFGSALGYLAGSFAGGLIAAAVGVALMQALLARGTRKRVRNAIADASTASVSSMSDSGDSDAYGIVQDVQMTDTAVSATQSVTQTVPMADSGESDVPAAQNVQNNVPDAQGVRHVKVADAAHSAAQAALEAAQAAQQAAQVAQQVAQTGQVPKIESQPQPSQPVAPLPSFEPKPVTAEIPLVADPTTGEVR